MNIFYTPDITEELYTLSEEESKHCIRVLRMRVGEEVNLVDGRGGFYKARVFDDTPKACVLKVFESIQEYEKRKYNLHIAVAPTKNTDRLEWLVEKSVEIGITEFTPVICEHSERKNLNTDRIERIVISAMKQSLKAYKPIVNSCKSFNEIINCSVTNTKLIAHCTHLHKVEIPQCYNKGDDVLILIGPEGDFTVKEVETATKAGFTGISLGPSRLRTETAGLAACHSIYFINESM